MNTVLFAGYQWITRKWRAKSIVPPAVLISIPTADLPLRPMLHHPRISHHHRRIPSHHLPRPMSRQRIIPLRIIRPLTIRHLLPIPGPIIPLRIIRLRTIRHLLPTPRPIIPLRIIHLLTIRHLLPIPRSIIPLRIILLQVMHHLIPFQPHDRPSPKTGKRSPRISGRFRMPSHCIKKLLVIPRGIRRRIPIPLLIRTPLLKDTVCPPTPSPVMSVLRRHPGRHPCGGWFFFTC